MQETEITDKTYVSTGNWITDLNDVSHLTELLVWDCFNCVCVVVAIVAVDDDAITIAVATQFLPILCK